MKILAINNSCNQWEISQYPKPSSAAHFPIFFKKKTIGQQNHLSYAEKSPATLLLIYDCLTSAVGTGLCTGGTSTFFPSYQ